MPFDGSYFRIIEIIIFFSDFNKGLKVMLISLKESFRYLMEALTIVLILTGFIALWGLHLFIGLFRNRCIHEYSGISIENRHICGYVSCDPGYFCGATLDNLD